MNGIVLVLFSRRGGRPVYTRSIVPLRSSRGRDPVNSTVSPSVLFFYPSISTGIAGTSGLSSPKYRSVGREHGSIQGTRIWGINVLVFDIGLLWGRKLGDGICDLGE